MADKGAIAVDARVTGAAEVARELRGLGDDVAHPDLAAVGTAMATAIAQAAPRRTGRLATSTRVERSPGRVAVTMTVPYAGPIDGGWPARNIEPANYTDQADQAATPTAVRLLEDDVNRSIRQRGLNR